MMEVVGRIGDRVVLANNVDGVWRTITEVQDGKVVAGPTPLTEWMRTTGGHVTCDLSAAACHAALDAVSAKV